MVESTAELFLQLGSPLCEESEATLAFPESDAPVKEEGKPKHTASYLYLKPKSCPCSFNYAL